MENNEAVQLLQQFILDHGLPKTDVALFGLKCPYCGKSDRIRQLESPEELHGKSDSEDVQKYSDFWVYFIRSNESLGVCKFCNNPLKIIDKSSNAEPLYT